MEEVLRLELPIALDELQVCITLDGDARALLCSPRAVPPYEEYEQAALAHATRCDYRAHRRA